MSRSDIGSDAWRRKEINRWFNKMLVAVFQVGAFMLMVGLHRCMEWGLSQVIPLDWKYLSGFVRATIGVVFVGIYVAITLDTLVLFVPGLDAIKRVMDGTSVDTIETVE